MQIKQNRPVSETEILIATGMREIGAQARVGALGTFSGVNAARIAQLGRDRDRALRRGDADRATELEAQMTRSASLAGVVGAQAERESIVPAPVPRGQAVVRGRITDRGRGRKGVVANLLDARSGAQLAQTTSGENGAFELVHKPQAELTLRITDIEGAHIIDQPGIAGPGLGGACYLEVAIDGIVPMPDPPEPPDPGSQPSHVKVPSLRGLSRDEAEAALRGAGLSGQFAGEVEASDLAGRVVDQEPKAGSAAERGSVVRYRIGADGKEGFPDFSGRPAGEVTAAINQLDLSIQNIGLVEDPERAGTVIRQLPQAGAPFNAATRVTLSVGTGQPEEDLQTAELLIAREAARSLPDLDTSTLSERFKESGVETLDDLVELTSADLGDFRERTRLGDQTTARRLQRMARVIVERFAAVRG